MPPPSSQITSTLGVAGERGSRHEGRLLPVPGIEPAAPGMLRSGWVGASDQPGAFWDLDRTYRLVAVLVQHRHGVLIDPQTLGLGYRDQWTRQHRFPAAEFVADDQGVTATVAAIAGPGLADYQRAASYLADTWGCVAVRAKQQGPGLVRLRGLHRDPLVMPARVDLSGLAPESLTSWWLGWAEGSQPVMI